MKDKLTALSKTFLFKDVPEDKLELVAQLAEEKFYTPGDTIFREGDYGGELYVIVSGSVGIEKRVKDERQELALGPGDQRELRLVAEDARYEAALRAALP